MPLKTGRKETDGIKQTRPKWQLTARSWAPNDFMSRKGFGQEIKAEQQREFRQRRHTNALIPTKGVTLNLVNAAKIQAVFFFFFSHNTRRNKRSRVI